MTMVQFRSSQNLKSMKNQNLICLILSVFGPLLFIITTGCSESNPVTDDDAITNLKLLIDEESSTLNNPGFSLTYNQKLNIVVLEREISGTLEDQEALMNQYRQSEQRFRNEMITNFRAEHQYEYAKTMADANATYIMKIISSNDTLTFKITPTEWKFIENNMLEQSEMDQVMFYDYLRNGWEDLNRTTINPDGEWILYDAMASKSKITFLYYVSAQTLSELKSKDGANMRDEVFAPYYLNPILNRSLSLFYRLGLDMEIHVNTPNAANPDITITLPNIEMSQHILPQNRISTQSLTSFNYGNDTRPLNNQFNGVLQLRQLAENFNNTQTQKLSPSMLIANVSQHVDEEAKMYVFNYILNEDKVSIGQMNHESGMRAVLNEMASNQASKNFINLLVKENYGMRFVTVGSNSSLKVTNEVTARDIVELLNHSAT